VRSLLCLLAFFSASAVSQVPDWLLVSESGRAQPGAPFELILAGPEGATLPDEIGVRLRSGVAEVDLKMQAAGPAENGRRRYAAMLPQSAGGPVAIRVADPPSNVVVLIVQRSDRMQSLTGAAQGEQEPPLSENEAMYFVVGASSHWSARYQLSFKYRLFDYDAGFGRDQPWLAGLYFAYTQTSLWDLEGESKPFFDTSYRPSLFWRWLRTDDRTWIDGVRIGLEHESNGQAGTDSRSLNTAFIQPEGAGRQRAWATTNSHPRPTRTWTRATTRTSSSIGAMSTGAHAGTRATTGSSPFSAGWALPTRAASSSTWRAARAT
jgi:hypothetical protein